MKKIATALLGLTSMIAFASEPVIAVEGKVRTESEKAVVKHMAVAPTSAQATVAAAKNSASIIVVATKSVTKVA